MNNNLLNIIDRDFTLLLDNLPIGIIKLNAEMKCVYINQLIYDLFEIHKTPKENQQETQLTSESTILHEISRRIHTEDLDKFHFTDEGFLLDKTESESVFRIWKESIHDWIWIINKKILINNDGNSNPISYIYTFQDIDKTKTMEIKLREQQLKLEQAYNHKSIFLANFSHELRSPIHGLLGMLSLLQDTECTQEQTDYINMIKECSFNLMTIITDILDYSKLEIGKITLDNKPMNLRECIESVNDMVVSRVIEKSIDYNYNIEKNVDPNIICDINRLKQLILNLVSNSVKFTDTGSIFLNVSKISKKDYILLKRHSYYENDDRDLLDPEDTVYLRFDVTDTGCGIDISQQNKLFKSFSQVDNKIKVYGGTGLGLAICKELSQLMGGYIWLDWSESNGGSRFSFVIKTSIYESDNINVITDDISLSTFQDLNILILDENVHNRISFTSMVNTWGMRAYCFSTVEEALYFTKITDFDIGLVDTSIQNIDTFLHNKHSNLPLIGLISFGEKIIENKYFTSYLTKPIKESRLKQCINQCITESTTLTTTGGTLIQTQSTITPIVNNVLGNHFKTTVKILLAEDVYVNQIVICRFLTKLGYVNTTVVKNGVECLEILKHQEFDIILLDIKMPLLNGDAVLQQIVNYYHTTTKFITGKFKNEKKPYTIAVTAYCLKDDKDKYLIMGFDDYLAKPIDINDLENCLNKFINKSLCEEN